MIAEPSAFTMCSQPLLSVVIPVRNGGCDLRACLESLEKSNHREFEIIVVDDASTDSSAAVARQMGARVISLGQQRGPAAARNLGARAARSDHILFLDADVSVRPETLGRVASVLASPDGPAAVFGSYDTNPTAGNIVSQYKNLLHHLVHQKGNEAASTFWAGCGAIHRTALFAVGGFDEKYTKPAVEDIELGLRLRNAGYRIVLDKGLEVTHRKRWTLFDAVKTDLVCRAIPWTRLLIREWDIPNDLNLRLSQRVSAVLACALAVSLLLAMWQMPALAVGGLAGLAFLLLIDYWSTTRRIPCLVRHLALLVALVGLGWIAVTLTAYTAVIVACVVGVVLLNSDVYLFFARQKHPLFAALVFPLHLVYFMASMTGFVLGITGHLISEAVSLVMPSDSHWEPRPPGRQPGDPPAALRATPARDSSPVT